MIICNYSVCVCFYQISVSWRVEHQFAGEAGHKIFERSMLVLTVMALAVVAAVAALIDLTLKIQLYIL